MRILFLSSVYPRRYAPVRGVYCRSLCRALAVGHDVRVVSPVAWTERLRCGTPVGGDQPRSASSEPPVEYPVYFYPPKVLRSHYGWFMWQSIRSRVRRTVEAFAPECVLSYWLHPDGEVAVRAARSLGVPSAVIVGGSDALLLPRDPARRRSIVKVLDEADALITVSEGLKDKVVELGAPEAKVHAIQQGIDTTLFSPGNRAVARTRLGLSAGPKVLLWVGGMVPVKGLDILVDACGLLAARGIGFRLCLVGDGPLRRTLAARVEGLGLSGVVTFVGSVTPDRLPDWYRAADLTVLSSWSEGIPNVLRESLACGTPFVATRVGDTAELHPQCVDALVPPGDPAALADAIAGALGDGDLRPPLPRLTSWAEYAEVVLDLIRPLARPGRPARPLAGKEMALRTKAAEVF